MFLVIFVLFYFTYAHAFFFAYTRAFTQAHTNRLQNYKKKLTYTRVYAIFCYFFYISWIFSVYLY